MTSHQNSLLSGREIEAADLIVDGSSDRYRASTYDLSVGVIIPGGKNPPLVPAGAEYRLVPGGMVRVVARESLRLPRNITGHALPRNTLCTRGVLAINIGIVDPGFEGPISSTLLNFGNEDYVIRPGEAFLRVSFHRCAASEAADNAQRWEHPRYIERAREQVLAYSGSMFLDLEQTVARAGEQAFGRFKRALALWVGVGALALAGVTIFVPLGASYVDRLLTNRVNWEMESHAAIQKESAAQIKLLRNEIDQLRDDLKAERIRPSRPSARKDGGQ